MNERIRRIRDERIKHPEKGLERNVFIKSKWKWATSVKKKC